MPDLFLSATATFWYAVYLLGGVAASPRLWIPKPYQVPSPMVCRGGGEVGAVEVCWRGLGRDRSGATEDKAPSSWTK